MLRDILKGADPQVEAVIDTIISAKPDVIALQNIDYDLQNAALVALANALKARGLDYPYYFAASPNAGLMTDIDLDGDGKTGGPGDAQGYGRFFGAGSMAILSRFPIDMDQVQDFSTLLWKDLPGHIFPMVQSSPFPGRAAYDVQRLSSHGHWVVPIDHPTLGRFNILTFHASPPVFDGPEDRNGRRNHDEVAFWARYFEGAFGAVSDDPFVLLGDANLDPSGGEGRSIAMQRLLAHEILQDPLPTSTTVEWDETGKKRVDYVLPSRDWVVKDAQITAQNPTASRHQLVWIDVTKP